MSDDSTDDRTPDESHDETQDEPIMHGSDEATDDEKAAGRDAQERADAEFYKDKDATNANQSDAEPKRSTYVNPSSSEFTHQEE
ncbi:hypothetical protein [Herbiconiux sp.]|uniref:hypothetical protein n=1 Tax=Herbiconiux sp. TaxID=1871186 RepID=UPI0025BADE15|nr:hypothetical protein [Herbiconiux sp.]